MNTKRNRRGATCLSLATLGLMAFIVACAPVSPPTLTYEGAVREVRQVPQDLLLVDSMRPRYIITGHYYTTEWVAKKVGINSIDAHAIAVFSQAPDDYVWLYSAVPVAVWGIINLPYRHRIMNTLHSLHGGDNAAVMARRQRLAELISTYDPSATKDQWKIGFLVHALGDSYAHVHGAPPHMKAYNEVYGHAIDSLLGKDHDTIEPATIETYLQFSAALYCALSRPEYAQAADQEGFTQWMDETRTTGTVSWNIDPEKKLSDGDRKYTEKWVGVEHLEEVDRFLADVTAELKKAPESTPSPGGRNTLACK